MKAQLKDGFEVDINEDAMNRWSFLSRLRKIDKGETGLIVDIAEQLLGEEQVEKLAEHLDDAADAMIAAIGEIMESVKELKNS